jgi:hypothetical protein
MRRDLSAQWNSTARSKRADQAIDRWAIAAKLIDYDPETGVLSWKSAIGGSTSVGRATGRPRKDGYGYVWIERKPLLAHRLAWLLHYGKLPELPVDHVNSDKLDNRICNLRLATVAENNRNILRSRNSKTGFKGVTIDRYSGKYAAKITAARRTYPLGLFDDPRHAAHVYNKAAVELHGEFACLNPL